MFQKPSWAVEGETIQYHLKGDASRMFTTGKIVRVLPGALKIQNLGEEKKNPLIYGFNDIYVMLDE
jgi:hypothetical protein